jgi:hypothetical protein
MESVTLCPDKDVPAALNVMLFLSQRARFMIEITSSSVDGINTS